MAHYIQQNDTVRVIDSGNIHTALPVANYIVQCSPIQGYFLERVESFALPPKLYGSVNKTTQRIISTFYDRELTTGVLLTGEKGAGKTILAKNISAKLALDGIPTLIINTSFCGDDFNRFIQSINQPCVIMFDEFEKVYDYEKQEHILTLLDGVFPTKKLFILTTNDTYRINTHMRNRPGRLFYSLKYTGLEDAFIREYCEDTLKNTSYTSELCKLAMLYTAFSFDMLKAIVEEMNRYDESPSQVLEMLNAIPDDQNDVDFDFELIVNGQLIPEQDVDNAGRWSGNPMRPQGFSIGYSISGSQNKPQRPVKARDSDQPIALGRGDAEDDSTWQYADFDLGDFIRADSVSGTFEFKTNDNEYIKLTRRKSTSYTYQAF